MANSDKNIVITPNTGLSSYPSIAFTGLNASPITLKVLDTGALSFSATAGQLFTIQDGLTGSLFAVSDISGIPLIEAMDTGIVKLNQYGGSTVIAGNAALLNSSNIAAKMSIYTNTATTPGLIIKAASSQTANLQEWQNSSSAVVTRIAGSGKLVLGAIGDNLLEFFNTIGNYGLGAISANGVANLNGGAFGYNYSQFGATVGIRPGSGSTSNIALSIRGEPSQTGDLQQWQDSSGSVLSRVDGSGNIKTTKSFIQIGTIGTTYALDTAGNEAVYAANATVNFPSFSGMILINAMNDGTVSLWLCGGAAAALVGGSKSGGYNGTVAYNSGIAGYTWTNANTSQTVSITAIRTRANA